MSDIRKKPTTKNLQVQVTELQQSTVSLYRYITHLHEALQAYDIEFKKDHDKLIEQHADAIKAKSEANKKAAASKQDKSNKKD